MNLIDSTLELQRTVGNRAVNRVLARERKLLRQVPEGAGPVGGGGPPRDAVVAVADFLRTHLRNGDYTQDQLRQGRDMENMLRRIALMGPPTGGRGQPVGGRRAGCGEGGVGG